MLEGWAAFKMDMNRHRSCVISDLRDFQDMTEKSLEQPALNSMLALLWESGWPRDHPASLRDSGIQGFYDSKYLLLLWTNDWKTYSSYDSKGGKKNHLMPHQTDYNVLEHRCLVSILQRRFFRDMKCR